MNEKRFGSIKSVEEEIQHAHSVSSDSSDQHVKWRRGKDRGVFY